VAGSGFAKNIVNVARYEIGEGFTGSVAKFGGEYNIKSREQLENLEIANKKVWEGKFDSKQWTSGENEFRNLIALPLEIKDQTLGVIKVENKRQDFGDYFSDDDLSIFKTIANVIALTIENARLQVQTEGQLKTISAMAGHRINNQVTRYDGISWRVKRLKEDSNHIERTQMTKDLIEIEEEIEAATQNLKMMIDDFRNYGKPIKLDKHLEDINMIIRDEIWLAQPPQDIKIHFDDNKDIPKIELDAARFAESIKELLNNAIRAIDEKKDGGNIYISSNLTTDSDTGKIITITIRDDGPGFPPNFPVFEPFNSTDPKRTGLGLATVKENIKAHGGTIELIENSSSGACFQMRFDR
jgi:signal transduction histidine kinase